MSEEFRYPLGPINTTEQRLQQIEELDATTGAVLDSQAARIITLELRCHTLEERCAALTSLLTIVTQTLYYHQEGHAEASSYADEELAGTLEALKNMP